MPVDHLGRDIGELFDSQAPVVKLDELIPHATVRPRTGWWRVGVMALLGVIVVGVIAFRPGADDLVTPPPDGVLVSPISLDEPIPLKVLAIRPNSPSFAMLDFETAATTIYPPGVHRSTENATDAAVFTSTGDLVVNSSGTAYLFSDTLDQEPIEITPEPLREIPGIASEIRIVPTRDGDRMWMIQGGIGYGDDQFDQYPTLIDLVEIPSGRHLQQAETESNAWPIAVTGTGLVLGDERLMDTGDGWIAVPGSQRVLHMLEDGSLFDVGPGLPIAATDDTIVRLVCVDDDVSCELVLTDVDGTNSRTIPKPIEGTWSRLGGPGIPSVSMPLETVSHDRSKLLMGLGNGIDVNDTPARSELVVVDLKELTANPIAEFDSYYPLATWSRDGVWIVVLRDDDVSLINQADPNRVVVVENVIPAEHFPLATG